MAEGASVGRIKETVEWSRKTIEIVDPDALKRQCNVVECAFAEAVLE